MARGWNCVFYRFLRPGAALQQLASGGLIVAWTVVLAFIMAVGLVAYLGMALLAPEKFS